MWVESSTKLSNHFVHLTYLFIRYTFFPLTFTIQMIFTHFKKFHPSFYQNFTFHLKYYIYIDQYRHCATAWENTKALFCQQFMFLNNQSLHWLIASSELFIKLSHEEHFGTSMLLVCSLFIEFAMIYCSVLSATL